MRAYKCDRCGSYYDVQSQIGPFYAEVLNKDDICSMDGKPTIRGKDLCQDCMNSLKVWFVVHKDEPKIEKEDINTIPLNELGLSSRVESCLRRAIPGSPIYIGDVVKLDYKQLTKIRNMGKNSIDELVTKLREFRVPYILHMLDNGNGIFLEKSRWNC